MEPTERTKQSSYEIMMEHVNAGEVPGCVVVIDPDDNEQSVLVSGFKCPEERELADMDGVVLAALAIKRAHERAYVLGLDPVY